MLVSLKNLGKFVDIKGLEAEEIANGLTFAGVEVEDVNHLAFGTNLCIGHILECEPHPDSNHLHVLKVDLGDKIEQIVCGAPNARKGLKVIVALPGAKLLGGEIKNGVIRGVESNGMCCSLSELGVDHKYLSEYQLAGIEELPDDAPVGSKNVLEYLGLDDVTLNLKVLANRPDLLSLYNVAREIGAIFNREVNIPSYSERVDFQTKLIVNTNNPAKCSQFSAKEIRGIKISSSPKWMSDALMAMGVRSINNIVDIGNYVMLLTGQPLHMYDADKLPACELIARDDLEGKFVALDENEYDLKKGDICITSNGQVMCLGGVMGGASCAVDENTTNIYIESASFDGATIRRTSNRLGLGSESSSRFVKGTNHFQSHEVIAFAENLIFELCSAEKSSQIVEIQTEEKKENKISSSVFKINNRLGTEFTDIQIKEVLERLHFVVEMSENGNFTATVPSWRLDVTCDADLSEEVIRLLGFDNVKSILPTLDVKVGALSQEQYRLKVIRDTLLSQGIDECLTYSLVSEKEVNAANLISKDEVYKLLNPLTDEREYFRNHILHSLLNAASYNVAHQNKNLALFETAKINTKVEERHHLAIVLVGQDLRQGLLKKEDYTFFHMKGILENVFKVLGIDASRIKYEVSKNNDGIVHPGKSADVYFQGQVIGTLGELHPTKSKEYDFGKANVVVLEMKLDTLLSAKVSEIKMDPISKFPSVSRDLAFVVNKDVMAKDLIKTIKIVGKGLVSNVEIFDVYEGENLNGKKSVAFTVTYSKVDATLTEKEVSDAENNIKFELFKTYKAELRG